MRFGSLLIFAGYRFIRTPAEGRDGETHRVPVSQVRTTMPIPERLLIRMKLALGALSAVAYLACWASLPIGILGPISTGLFWLSIVIWFVTRTSQVSPHWNKLFGISLTIIWCLHAAAWHFVREVPHVDRFALPLYAVVAVGPGVYSRMKYASYSLTAFMVLLGPWEPARRLPPQDGRV